MWKNEPKNGSRTNMKKVAGNNAASVRIYLCFSCIPTRTFFLSHYVRVQQLTCPFSHLDEDLILSSILYRPFFSLLCFSFLFFRPLQPSSVPLASFVEVLQFMSFVYLSSSPRFTPIFVCFGSAFSYGDISLIFTIFAFVCLLLERM